MAEDIKALKDEIERLRSLAGEGFDFTPLFAEADPTGFGNILPWAAVILQVVTIIVLFIKK